MYHPDGIIFLLPNTLASSWGAEGKLRCDLSSLPGLGGSYRNGFSLGGNHGTVWLNGCGYAYPDYAIHHLTLYNPAPRTGGVVNVRARVANADQCRLRALSARVDHSVFSTAWQSCVNGAFDTHITFGANLGVTNREQRFEILGKEDHATYALRTFMAVSDGAGSARGAISRLLRLNGQPNGPGMSQNYQRSPRPFQLLGKYRRSRVLRNCPMPGWRNGSVSKMRLQPNFSRTELCRPV